MMDLKNFNSAIGQIAEEKGISKERVFETIEQAIAAAYKKEYSTKNAVVRAKMDPNSGEVKFWQVKIAVDKDMIKEEDDDFENPEISIETAVEEEDEKKVRFSEEKHIWIEEAKKINSEAMPGDEIIFPLEVKEDFGRIAAQTAKQVILQRLREAEREAVFSEFKNKEGEIISGVIQRIERRNVFVNLGRTQGIMFYNESIPGERYRIGDRLKFLILAIQEEGRGPMIVLSRSHPKFIEKLFELEVPEINTGTVKIMAIAREAGSRTKVAVFSSVEGVDPIGSCVGQKGTRVMAILNELGQEKIDIVRWFDNPEKFVGQAISPAKASKVEILERRDVRVYVPEDQLSLAIGKGGQNVRLAAKLTGWKIDVRSEANPEEAVEGGISDGAEESSVEESSEGEDSENKKESKEE